MNKQEQTKEGFKYPTTPEERFDVKIHTYDKDKGFIVYVEGYDNNDFDIDLIRDFISEEISQAVQKERERAYKEGYKQGRFDVEMDNLNN